MKTYSYFLNEKIDLSKMDKEAKKKFNIEKTEMNLNILKLKLKFYGKYSPEKRKKFTDKIKIYQSKLLELKSS